MEYKEIEASPAYQLWQATNAWQREIRRALEPIGLTHVQYIILASIDLLTQKGGAPSQVDVCQFASLDANMTSQVLRSLIGRNLVSREQSLEDRRCYRLSLTSEGASLRSEARAVVKPTTDSFFAPLGADAAVLADLLRKLHS